MENLFYKIQKLIMNNQRIMNYALSEGHPDLALPRQFVSSLRNNLNSTQPKIYNLMFFSSGKNLVQQHQHCY